MGCRAPAKFLSTLLDRKKGTPQNLLLRTTQASNEALHNQVIASSLWASGTIMQNHHHRCYPVSRDIHDDDTLRDIMHHHQRLHCEPRKVVMCHVHTDIMHHQRHQHVQRDFMHHHLHKSIVHHQDHPHVMGDIMHHYHHHVHRRIMWYNLRLHYHHDAYRNSRNSMWNCKCLHVVASQEGAGDDSKQHKVDEGSWEDLESKMQLLRGGIAKGEALEALKFLVDKLMPCAAPDDFPVGEACLALAQSYASADEEPTKFLCYAQRAPKAYESFKESSDYARCLYLLGYAFFKMEEYQNAVVHLEGCSSALSHLTEMACNNEYCDGLKPEVQGFLGRAKMLLAKPSEALTHYRNFLELKEKLLEPGHPELGTAYVQAARGFRGLKDVDAAMHASSKALEIYTKCFGLSSLEVAEVRSLLSGLYCDLGKYKDSLIESEAARPILEQSGDLEEVAYLDFSIAECLTHLGRHAEAILKLEEVIRGTELTSAVHFNALLMAARACATTKRNECVAVYCTKAFDVLQHREASAETALSLALLALVYEEQRESKQAIFVLKKAKSILDTLGLRSENVPAFAAADLEGKIGFLLLRVGKANEAIPYIENSLSKKKSIHVRELLYLHFNLGAAYLQVRRFQEALRHVETSKRILSGGVPELDASKRAAMYNNIAGLYKSCRRHKEAIECEKAAAALLKKHEVEKADNRPARNGVS